MNQPNLTLVANNFPIGRSDNAKHIISLCKKGRIRLVATNNGGYKRTPTTPSAA